MTRQARRSETPNLFAACSKHRRRLAGLRGFPQGPHAESACPGSDQAGDAFLAPFHDLVE